MALSAPTLTAPPGFALRWVKRASPKGACPPPLILDAGGGVPPAGGWRKRTSFRCTFRHGGRGTGACIPAAAPRKRTGFLFAPAHKTPARSSQTTSPFRRLNNFSLQFLSNFLGALHLQGSGALLFYLRILRLITSGASGGRARRPACPGGGGSGSAACSSGPGSARPWPPRPGRR